MAIIYIVNPGDLLTVERYTLLDQALVSARLWLDRKKLPHLYSLDTDTQATSPPAPTPHQSNVPIPPCSMRRTLPSRI